MPDILRIRKGPGEIQGQLNISGSKSESNRLLILKSLYCPSLKIKGLSRCNDTQILVKALSSSESLIDVEDAGTAMRFLVAYFAISNEKPIILKGSSRMHQRPIGILVRELQNLGAKIEYLEKHNFPPLKILPSNLIGNSISVESGISSQYISALMMIGPKFPNGLQINLKGKTVSQAYIELTAQLMKEMGFEVNSQDKVIKIEKAPKNFNPNLEVEADWSSASYWYLMVCLSKKAKLKLRGFKPDSIQGDSIVASLFVKLGVKSSFEEGDLILEKVSASIPTEINLNLIKCPDLAQSIIVAMAALGITGKISGLQTLRIKETDRLHALKIELEKTGAEIRIGKDFLQLTKGVGTFENLEFSTWSDHRMAMSLAALSLLAPIRIQNPEVVDKSYPNFWLDMKQMGFEFEN